MLQMSRVITNRIEDEVHIQSGTVQIDMNNSMIGDPIHSTESHSFLHDCEHAVPCKLYILSRSVGMGCQIDRYWDIYPISEPVASEIVESLMVPQIESSGSRFMSNVQSGTLQCQRVGFCHLCVLWK